MTKWSSWFLVCFVFLNATFFIFAFADNSKLLTDLLANGGMNGIFIWFKPLLPWLVPISAFMGTIICVLFLRRENEWLALQTSGISPVLFLLVFLFLGCIPMSIIWYVSISASDEPFEMGKTETGSFRMKVGNSRVWFFEDFNESSMTGTGLQLYDYDDKGNDVFRIRAQKAHWFEKTGWVFKKGSFLSFATPKGYPNPDTLNGGLKWYGINENSLRGNMNESLGPLLNKRFSSLSLPEINDHPIPHLLLLRKPKELSLGQINALLARYPSQNEQTLHPYRLRKAQLLMSAPSCLLAILIAFAIGAGREKVKIGYMVGMTLLGIILFYVLRTFCDSLGEQGLVRSWMAASIPYFVSAAVALVLFWQKR